MWLKIIILIVGIFIIAKSADLFVDGACGIARRFGMSPLLIGMVIVGFGTSVPEMLVSASSSLQGSPSLALGNAYGSNIANIALILGVAALINPIKVDPSIMKKELPSLCGATLLSVLLIRDGEISRIDAVIMLVVFVGLMIFQSIGKKSEFEEDADNQKTLSAARSACYLFFGLVLLIASSEALVWAAKGIAVEIGISELIIGLTIIAVGTSLPELASSVAAARKNEHEVALGNVIGSNFFNTLCVVGIAAAITSLPADDPRILSRDIVVMSILTLMLFYFAARKKISRPAGAFLLVLYVAYNVMLAFKMI